MKNINTYINESSNIDDILLDVEDWFYNHTNEDSYDNQKIRKENLEAMSTNNNDPMVDLCIEHLDLTIAEQDKFYEYIVKKLQQLSKEELKKL